MGSYGVGTLKTISSTQYENEIPPKHWFSLWPWGVVVSALLICFYRGGAVSAIPSDMTPQLVQAKLPFDKPMRVEMSPSVGTSTWVPTKRNSTTQTNCSCLQDVSNVPQFIDDTI